MVEVKYITVIRVNINEVLASNLDKITMSSIIKIFFYVFSISVVQ